MNTFQQQEPPEDIHEDSQHKPSEDILQERHQIKKDDERRRKKILLLLVLLIFLLVGIISAVYMWRSGVLGGRVTDGVKTDQLTTQVEEKKQGLPDLMLSAVFFDKQTSRLVVSVKNVGFSSYTSDGDFGIAWSYVDTDGNTIGASEGITSDIYLKEGQSLDFTIFSVVPPQKASSIIIFVDAGPEKTKLNNAFIYSLGPGAPQMQTAGNTDNKQQNEDEQSSQNTDHPSSEQQVVNSMIQNAEQENNEQIIQQAKEENNASATGDSLGSAQTEQSTSGSNDEQSDAGESTAGDSSNEEPDSTGTETGESNTENTDGAEKQDASSAPQQQVDENSENTSPQQEQTESEDTNVIACYWEDTDGGFNPDTVGSCRTNKPDAPYQKSITDYCKDTHILVEYQVNNSCGGCEPIEVTCDNGCSDGRCIQTRPAPTTKESACYWEDTDGGFVSETPGECRTNDPNASYQKSIADYCKDANVLVEFNVNNSCTGCDSRETVCDNGCSDGRCIQTRQAPNTRTSTDVSCDWEDTDRGYNIEEQGECRTDIPDASYQKSLKEYCKDDTTLIEYEVNNSCGGCDTYEVTCDNGCSEGACISYDFIRE